MKRYVMIGPEKFALSVPRKRHRCRLCDQWIEAGEECLLWSGVEPGEGWWTSHAHPECYAETDEWDNGDWECHSPGDDFKRPEQKLETVTNTVTQPT